MTLNQKIEILQLATAGRIIQVRNLAPEPPDWPYYPSWQDMPHYEWNSFNFGVYEYRLKPETVVDSIEINNEW